MEVAPIVGISGSIISKEPNEYWHIFQEGLESRDQLQQEVETLQEQAAIAERLNAIGAIPAESTAQETPVARTRDMGKTPEPWEAHEVIIRAVLLHSTSQRIGPTRLRIGEMTVGTLTTTGQKFQTTLPKAYLDGVRTTPSWAL